MKEDRSKRKIEGKTDECAFPEAKKINRAFEREWRSVMLNVAERLNKVRIE